MRFGLCCLFKQEKISFRSTTATVLFAMNRGEQLPKLSGTRSARTALPLPKKPCWRKPVVGHYLLRKVLC
jgi:hypothetical protein